MPALATEITPAELLANRIEVAEAAGYRYAYGSLFPPVYDAKGNPRGLMPDWMVEAHCCRATGHSKKMKLVEGLRPKEYQGFVEHFKKFIAIVWGPDNQVLHLQFNPNCLRIIDEIFVEGRKFTAIAGHKNSSKTETIAVVAVALFLISPRNTKCVATSLTLGAAKAKIWGRIQMAWNAATKFFGEENMPGVETDKIIQYRDGNFKTATAGLELIAGEQKQSKQSLEKLQGMKQENVFIAADELATLAHGIVETCRDNLTGNPNFRFCGSFNPNTYFDASRLVAEPKAGWESITVDSDGWETNLGYCIHFDGVRSPNVVAGEVIWKGLYNRQQLMSDREFHRGENTATFWSQIRGFWSPVGAQDAIYSGHEIMTYHGDRHKGNGWHWADEAIKLAGLDPAFVGGGDRAVAYHAQLGDALFEDGSRRRILEFIEYKELAEDVTKGHDKPRMVCDMFREQCETWGVPVQNTAVDVTGAASFGSLLRTRWGDGFLEVKFSESASDAPISDTDSRPAKEEYQNKRAELWFSGKPLLRSQQLKGIDPDLAAEICSCTFHKVGGKVVVESKEDMKKRTGRSPDVAESAWVVLQLARERFDLLSTEKARGKAVDQWSDDQFRKWAEQIAGVKIEPLVFEG